MGDCSLVLDDATALKLAGPDNPEPASCDWLDGSTLVVYLSGYTAIEPGMEVKLRDGVIWPLAVESEGLGAVIDCDAEGNPSFCAMGVSMTLNKDFPCDRRATEDETELCTQPVAKITGASKIGVCPDTALKLDGSTSTGGGVAGLVFRMPCMYDESHALGRCCLRVRFIYNEFFSP